MTDDYGNFIGYMYNTFDHGNLTIKTGDMVFDYTYTLSPDHRFVEFGDGGKYMLGEETVMTNTGDQMEKISDLSSSPSNSSESNYNNSQSNAERNIMAKLHQLNEKAKQKMPRIEALYRRQQQAQRQGILSNPNAQFDLNDAINEIIDIKNEQIRLAEQLGDAQLVREYKDQRNKIYEAKDKMLYGR